VHNWLSIANTLWNPEIVNVFRLIEQVLERFNNMMTTEMTFPTERFVNWIDARLYRIRRTLASSATHRLIDAISEISVSHFSFDGVKLAAQKPTQARSMKLTTINNAKSNIPIEIVSMIPTNEHGKQACLRFWSKIGCKSKGKSCENEARAHFKPQKSMVNDKLIEFIKERYGGIKNDAFTEG
jgi:hypothetical protein